MFIEVATLCRPAEFVRIKIATVRYMLHGLPRRRPFTAEML
ncbi:hypothetical protein NX02_04165 [Sphingomonas sanxanigenens DSM 19645 = NX02]|uniref:Uncharacterized protein n=1 Tax=Sphingomonas sanxanigenens DSM 19645 = NX02 TaxID=1123269 RepID=W0A7Y5_9SPHN|nr:hypothetical protein NX02_04165 [Sphingomonas sanxanigenens DSM 19645 = NX02]